MAIKKNPVSPRQKMINLMYVVLTAMLALNVSTDVLKGLAVVSDSLERSTSNAEKENTAIYEDFQQQMKANPTKVGPWFAKAREVKAASDSLCNYADVLKWAIAREADGKEGTPLALENKDDLNASDAVMLNGPKKHGRRLFEEVNHYREFILKHITDPRQRAIIASNLSTEVPKTAENRDKQWQEYMFETMPAIAAVTMLSKLQSDVRKAESEVLRSLIANIDVRDIRVNELGAYCLPEQTTLFPGDEFRSHIFMAAVDTTQRPEIFVNGKRIAPDGTYNFRVGAPGEYDFSGYIMMPNAAGEIIRRDFKQHYNVIAPPTGATVAADLMNVLYAGYDNPVSVSASGVSSDKISVSMTGGTLTAKGDGHYVARPEKVGQDVNFSITGIVNGKSQPMGNLSFKVRKLPDPTAYIQVGDDMFRGGRIAKGSIIGAKALAAAIDDGLLNIPFRVLSFECVFFDRVGNVRPEKSAGPNFTDSQRELMRTLNKGKRFYISSVRAIGPDGIERTLPGSLEVIIN
ncbi:MAG: gliding motility protein GldM [Alloprevotella sp.]